ncbi:MAG TPA: SAM-dependent methyltransferase, partial [Methyloceanibacter sp.]|nr:SAM-dependent methyltransferase [Methyloceanibacter sp.]
MFHPLRYMLDRIVTSGQLILIDAGGRSFGFGDHHGMRVVARVADRRAERRLALHPTLALGEAYMDGRLIIEQGTIYDFIDLLAVNLDG